MKSHTVIISTALTLLLRTCSSMEGHVYIQRGALSLVLRAARVAGLAPISLTSLPNGYNASLSVVGPLYGYLLITVVDICLLTGVVSTFLPASSTIALQSTLLSSVPITLPHILILIITTGVGYYGAAGRMKCMIDHLSMLEKVNKKMDDVQRSESQDKRFAIFVITLVSTSGGLHLLTNVLKEGNQILPCLYHLQSFLLTLLQMQILLIHFEVATVLEMMCKKMRNLVVITKTEYISDATLKTVYGDVRSLIQSYLSICKVVMKINKDNGSITFLIFVYNIFTLILTGYCAVVELNFQNRLLSVIFELIWIVYIILNVFIFVEPSHQIKKKTQQMQTLLCHLTYNFKPLGQRIPIEFAIFQQQFILNKPPMSPLGIFNINRALVVKVLSIAFTCVLFTVQMKTRTTKKYSDFVYFT